MDAMDLSNDGRMTAMDRGAAPAARLAPWLPVAAALAYPWSLKAFHAAAAAHLAAAEALWLALAFALPLGCLWLASTQGPARLVGAISPSARRLAYAALGAPPLFVLTGVAAGLLHAPLGDLQIWSIVWLALGVVATLAPGSATAVRPRPLGRLRVAHGITAALILLFVAFHLFNHLMGLGGASLHKAVMTAGRTVYRSPFVEPVLVTLLLFQVASGARLAWRWSATAAPLTRTLQVGSGAYLAAFILTHLNSALISARLVHHQQTDWAWASGAPAGLIADAWNIRLLPHYALGVFFVIAHLACGLRDVMLAHHAPPAVAQRVWLAGLLGGAALSVAITCALCGLRL
jgi:succinate dehydrogenase/fumarate reductase cytochrome b subunit